MAERDHQGLCLALMHADSEREVVRLLTEAGYWSNEAAWRWLGDQEYNYSTAGNQQSRAEQAIVEKLINSIDAKLLAEARLAGCLPKAGSEPQSPDTPTSIQEARQRFFGDKLGDSEQLSRGITVAATAPGTPRQGYERPCFTIVDDGEGQTPKRMPGTILSLLQGNKDKIRFAQGKFNMGGTGVLEFCGMERNLQLVVSKRHPALLEDDCTDTNQGNWSFTVIRREDPSDGRSSRYVYLAPEGCDLKPNGGELLSFAADSLPIFPEQSEPYVRHSRWGTLIKLYEYDAGGFRTGMMYEGGLMYRARIMLPEPALPIRFHECRPFQGKKGSFDTTMPGLVTTLKNDLASTRRDNVEWYDEIEFDVEGEPFSVKLFLFKGKKAADNYRSDEGVVFSYNGQCHAVMTKDFFRRRKVGMDYLWHCLLAFVDCSAISIRAHERLFMNNRDHLRINDFMRKLETKLQEEIHDHEELRTIQSERRKKEAASNHQSSDSMAKAIEKILLGNKALAQLLGEGFRIKNPHRPDAAGEGVVGFIGKRFPTKFHLKGRNPGAEFIRDAHLDSKVRLTFETDAANDYFRRDSEPGVFKLYRIIGEEKEAAINYSRPRLASGIARMSLELPADARAGDELTYRAEVTDPSRIEPFAEDFVLSIRKKRDSHKGGSGGARRSGNTKGDKKGPDNQGAENQKDSYLGVPIPYLVEEKDWAKHEPEFNKFTAVRIKRNPDAKEDEEKYDYYVNISNAYLTRFVKENPKSANLMKRRFSIGMTLLALAVLHQEQMKKSSSKKWEDFPGDDVDVHERVAQTTAALAPFLLPMIESLSALPDEEDDVSDSAGEAA